MSEANAKRHEPGIIPGSCAFSRLVYFSTWLCGRLTGNASLLPLRGEAEPRLVRLIQAGSPLRGSRLKAVLEQPSSRWV